MFFIWGGRGGRRLEVFPNHLFLRGTNSLISYRITKKQKIWKQKMIVAHFQPIHSYYHAFSTDTN
uniref:Uncharacterized protein n=1 Tax=Rhizophora mucronata TaxID=61149 RepID=A0A2P2QWG1_RHIMU